MTARLGLGLIGVGRPWPLDTVPVASSERTRAIIETARLLGVSFFDTAPAYGLSEERLGQELCGRLPEVASDLVVSTKCGEFWSPEQGSWTDHSSGAVIESVKQSHARLGRIDILYVHKASAEVLADRALLKLLVALADDFGIAHLGASVKDVASCDAALEAGLFGYLQCPVNRGVPELSDWVGDHARDIVIVANRPYGSGRLVDGSFDPRALLAYVLDRIGDGIVLTGTTSPTHLRQTHAAFTAVTSA